MGHVQTDMASIYRELMTDDRLSDVACFVGRWLMGKESAKIESTKIVRAAYNRAYEAHFNFRACGRFYKLII